GEMGVGGIPVEASRLDDASQSDGRAVSLVALGQHLPWRPVEDQILSHVPEGDEGQGRTGDQQGTDQDDAVASSRGHFGASERRLRTHSETAYSDSPVQQIAYAAFTYSHPPWMRPSPTAASTMRSAFTRPPPESCGKEPRRGP